MKKVISAIVLIIMSGCFIMHGQIISSYGLKAGVSIANQSYYFTPLNYALPTDVKFGPGGSVFIEAFSGKKMSFQLDLGIISKGCKTTAESLTVNHLNKDSIIVNEGPLVSSKFNYLSISPMLRCRQEMNRTNAYILLGPRMDLLLSYNTNSNYPIKEQTNAILGLTGAFGVEYKLARLTPFAEIIYQPDLSPVTNNAPLLVNNNLLMIVLGVRLGGGYEAVEAGGN